MLEKESGKRRTDFKGKLYSVMLCNYFFAVITLCLTGQAFAQTPMQDVLCLLVSWFTGNLGWGLATIGVSAGAIGAIFGKISWGLALTILTGVAVMFGATNLLVTMGAIPGGVCP